MADKQDEILEKQKAILEELKALTPIVSTVVEHTIKIANLSEYVKKYQDVQIPKCDEKFEKVGIAIKDTNTSISNKVGGVYGRLWAIVIIFLASLLAIFWKIIAGSEKP